MPHARLTTVITHLGLRESEADVYLACLSLGPSTVLAIARRTGLKRTTVYGIIESLKQKGLLHEEIRGWKKLFVAANPETLESLMDARRVEFQKCLPDLMSLHALHEHESYIRLYEGKTAVATVYDNLLKHIQPHEKYCVVGDIRVWMALDENFFTDFIKRRSKLPIDARILLQDSDMARQHKRFERNHNERIKILPADTSFDTNLVVTPQMSVIHQLTEPTSALVVENKNIARMHLQIFEMLWNSIPD